MEQNLNLPNDGINLLLNEKRINEEIKIDMYRQLKSFQILFPKIFIHLPLSVFDKHIIAQMISKINILNSSLYAFTYSLKHSY